MFPEDLKFRAKFLKASKMDFDFSALSKEEKYLISYIKDLIPSAKASSCFLNEREQALAFSVVKNSGDSKFFFSGGYPEAERKILFIGDESDIQKKISVLEIRLQKNSVPVKHSAVLGSILALGIQRSVLGDIVICSDSCAIVFVQSEMTEYLSLNLTRIGKDACVVNPVDLSENLLPEPKREEVSFVVASDRIDCLIGGLTNKSRNFVSDLFSEGKVFQNQQQIGNLSKRISAGDKISVRGFGKYEIKELSQTKKGRLRVCILRYI